MAGVNRMNDKKFPSDTLADALLREKVRVRELMVLYAKMGPAGQFGLEGIETTLRQSDRAMIEQEVPAMIVVLDDLRNVQ